MILLLQILAVTITGAFGLMFTMLIIGPALGGLIHGRRFTLVPWHALAAALTVGLSLWLAITFGWVVPA